MKLRDYQTEAVLKVFEEWRKNRRKTLVVCPTGTGKTIIFATVIEKLVEQGKRVLVIAHREELLNQAADKIERKTGVIPALEKGTERAAGSSRPVIVASIQTLQRDKRLHQFSPNYFDAIIIDEAHHSISTSYQKVINYFDGYFLGVTATPDRGDRKNLGRIFDSLAYEYTMPKAIQSKYLVPIIAKQIPLQIDLREVHQTGGDFSVDQSGHAIEPYLAAIAKEIKTHCVNRKTVIFLPLIDTSKKMVAELKRIGIRAREINGKTKNRADVLADFEAGKYDVLCNAMLLTEGWDCPAVDCIVVLRPTKIRSLFVQMVGRGTRPAPNKNNLLLLDFLWQVGRIELCRPADILTDNEEKAQRMRKKMEENEYEELDLMELMDEAQRDIVAEREESVRDQLEKNRRRRGSTIDVMQLEFSIGGDLLSDYEPVFKWQHDLPTEKQLKRLKGWGVDTQNVNTKGEASVIIQRLYKRKNLNLSTPRQIKTLERYGIKNAGAWDFNKANEAISLIANNKWRMTPQVRYQLYEIEQSMFG